MKEAKVLSECVVFDDFYQMIEGTYQLTQADGTASETIRRLCFERGDGVCGVVYNTDTQRAILVKQFRYPCHANGDSWMVEAVAGMLHKGNDKTEEMKREVLEEIGYAVKHIEKLSTFYVSPGGSSERIHLFHIEVDNAGKVASGGGLAHETEDIEIIEYTLSELKIAVDTNEIKDAKTILGCMHLFQRMGI
jgi:nudix-type nucleoside diphosphatase (YffH/AdpP family)